MVLQWEPNSLAGTQHGAFNLAPSALGIEQAIIISSFEGFNSTYLLQFSAISFALRAHTIRFYDAWILQ